MRHIWAACLLLASCGPAYAQGWPPWADDAFGRRAYRPDRWEQPPQRWQEPERYPDRSGRPQQRSEPQANGGDVRDGGARPEIMPVAPSIVSFAHDYPANSIVIDTGARRLYYVLEGKRAYEYTISVGREGFSWTGTEKISRKQAWPDWYPPAEMRERDQSLPVKMTGGLKNPLGAMALYLGNTLYRIHGTNDANSLGRAQSSGCFRMLNANVLHLATLADTGTAVTVVRALGQGQEVARATERRQQPVAQRPAAQVEQRRGTWSVPDDDDEDAPRPPRWRTPYGGPQYPYPYGRRYW